MPPAHQTFGDVPNPPLEKSAAAVVLAYAAPGCGGEFDGPRRILEASAYVELYDEELESQAAGRGLHTDPEPLTVSKAGDMASLERLRRIHAAGAFPVLIGDDPRLSALAMAASRRAEASAGFVLLTGNLPADDFSRWLRAWGTDGPVGLLGLKSPPAAAPSGWALLSPARALMEDPSADPWAVCGRAVHLSIRPDFFEPAVLPSAGNMEPGGLDWWRSLGIMRSLFAGRRVIGMDVCGHRPERGKLSADFTLAKLICKAVGYRLCLQAPSANG